MRCPSCNKRAISFVGWASGMRWARYHCPHCSAALKASRRTVLAVIVCLLPLPVYIWGANGLCETLHISIAIAPILATALAVPLTLVIAAWDWSTGSYALAKLQNEQTDR